jgi:hypothetical protein
MEAVILKAYRRAVMALGVPDDVLVSEHAVPAPEVAANPVAMISGVFAEIDRAARSVGLSDRGVFMGQNRELSVAWDRVADAEIESRAALLEHGATHGEYWPWGYVLWSDPSRSTFLLVTTDWDCTVPEEIMAWGRDAPRCLSAVEIALDSDELWE